MTNNAIENDWLLNTGRIGSQILRYFLLVVAALAGILSILAFIAGVVGVLSPETLANISDDPVELRESFGIAALMALLCFAVWLASKFFTLLSQIIATVGDGDPFIEENADRLHSMGMINLVICGISLAAAAGILIYTGVYDIIVEDLTFHISLDSLFIAILLFILARVFRHGAAMRADLEGTV